MGIEQKIGLRIRQMRLSKALTQEELAGVAGINRTYMNHIENGRKNISVQTLEKIVHALGADFPGFFKSFKRKT